MAEYAHGGPVGTGTIRVVPDDFRVEELTGYAPSGAGEHVWIDVEKRGVNTVDAARALADFAGVAARAVGFAGLKDRNAVTRQPFSIPMAGRADPDWCRFSHPGLRVLQVTRHHRKIRRGRLAGNRFELCVRELDADRSALEQRLSGIAAAGVPNRFGEQRFGGNNIARAHRLFRGELRRKPSKAKRGFYLSAARSLVFNEVLDRRIAQRNWNTIIHGDVVMLDGTRSWFVADSDDPDLHARAGRLDLHPTGPLVGEQDTPATGKAAEIERQVMEARRELVDGLGMFRLQTDRRPLRMRVTDLDWRFPASDRLELRFTLRPGCYATAVLRELLAYRDARGET